MGSDETGEAVELIHYNVESGKFEVGQRSVQILRTLKGPMAVVAVCGRARQGKSFILNQLLHVSGGFTIGSTHRPCTKGLWMWSHPQRHTAPDGSDFHMVRHFRTALLHGNTNISVDNSCFLVKLQLCMSAKCVFTNPTTAMQEHVP